MKLVRKKIDKIYKAIDKIAKKGKDNIQEYKDFIDLLIDKGDYGFLEQTLYQYYDIQIEGDSNYVKEYTYKEILFYTNSNFLTKLKKIFDSKGIYQVGLDFFLSSNNLKLGQIIEKDVFKENTSYYLQNKNLATAIKEKRTFLEVYKNETLSTLVDDINDAISEEQNLLNRYSSAIDLLKS
jgi:uncharacterized membrane protein YcgQ (UPF0703/DUF1980 family)